MVKIIIIPSLLYVPWIDRLIMMRKFGAISSKLLYEENTYLIHGES